MKEAIPVEEDTKLVYRCDCGSTTFNINLFKKDPSTGERDLEVLCSECETDCTSCLDY